MKSNVGISWLPQKSVDPSELISGLKVCEETNRWANGGTFTKELALCVHELLGLSPSLTVIPTCSGTAALHALVEVYQRRSPTRKWEVSDFAWSSSWSGPLATANVVDIDENSLLLVPKLAESYRVVTTFGGFQTWEDSSFPSRSVVDHCSSIDLVREEPGLGSAISFHHTKPWGFGEGGAIICPKDLESEILEVCGYEVCNFSLNRKMSELAALVILQYFQHYQEIRAKHRYLYELFRYFLADISEVVCLPSLSASFPAWFPLVFSRYVGKDEFLSQGVEVMKYYAPYYAGEHLAMSVFSRLLCFPIHSDLDEHDIHHMVSAIKKVL